MAATLSKVYEVEFKNEPPIDFSDPVSRQAMQDALSKIERTQPREYGLRRKSPRKRSLDRSLPSSGPEILTKHLIWRMTANTD